MKNINKYTTPFDKMRAHVAWCEKHQPECPWRDCCTTNPSRHEICFNAWLHSATPKIPSCPHGVDNL